jgi:hypothetical protein
VYSAPLFSFQEASSSTRRFDFCYLLFQQAL